MTEHQQAAAWNVSDWHGKMVVDCHGEKIGKLQDVSVDVETDEPQFATVKEGLIDRHSRSSRWEGPRLAPTSSRWWCLETS